jgi:hypothetical protein
MNSFFSRTSENVLFAVLITAVIGWTAVTVATDVEARPASSTSCATRPA